MRRSSGRIFSPAFFRLKPAFCKSATRRWRWLLPCVCAWTTWACVALRTTLSSLLNGLKRYDAVFFAHHVPGDIDYQLCMPVSESLMGVDYALRYLQKLELEDELLTCFPIHRVLALLARRKRPLARAGLQPADPGAGKRHGAHAARQTAAQAACLRRRPCGAAGHALRQDRRRACAPVRPRRRPFGADAPSKPRRRKDFVSNARKTACTARF